MGRGSLQYSVYRGNLKMQANRRNVKVHISIYNIKQSFKQCLKTVVLQKNIDIIQCVWYILIKLCKI